MNTNKVVMAGAGTMGASLAQVYAQAGWDTVLYNRSDSGLKRAKNLIEVNQAVFVKEGLGYQLTFDGLVDTSPESGLVFRPLSPRLETKLFLIWNKYQTFTPIAERFLKQVRGRFRPEERYCSTN